MALIGYALQWFVLNRTLGDDLLPPLLVTFGLSVIIQNGLADAVHRRQRKLQAGAIEVATIRLVDGVYVGVLPLLQFVVAVAVIAALQFVFYRTALGRAFRATADDPAVAQLMGLDNRHVFALAMALSLAVVAIAGVFLAVRANFDPSQGPARLIFGFEAVIIGGLGSLWGTLAGGLILGVAQAIGAHLNPGWQILAGHIAFLVVLAVRPRGPVPQGAHMSVHAANACVAFASRSSRIGMALCAVGLVALAAAPFWGGRDDLALLSEIYAYVALASLWNLLAGYAGLVSVGQQAYVGLGAYVLFALAILAGMSPLWAIPLAGVIAAAVGDPGRGAWCSGCAAIISRSAPGSWPRCSACSPRRFRALGGGSGTSLPAAVVIAHGAVAAAARFRRVLDRAGAGGRGAGPHRAAAALALWPRAQGDPRQRAGGDAATASTSRAPRSWSISSPRSAPPWSAR